MNTVGKNIKKLRIAGKMTQEDLAAKMFVTRQTISNWETGKSQPDLETISALSEQLHVSGTELIYGVQTPYKRFQKRFIITAALSLCVIVAVILLECLYYPQLIEEYRHFFQGGFNVLLYIYSVRPLGFCALGVFVVSLLSLWVDTRMEKKVRIVILIIGIVLFVLSFWVCVEVILIYKAPQVFPGFILYTPVYTTQFLRMIFLIVLPLLSGAGLFLGCNRK